jgi:hypothetical protein
MPDPVVTTHVVGIDIGMESCTMSCLTMDKREAHQIDPVCQYACRVRLAL